MLVPNSGDYNTVTVGSDQAYPIGSPRANRFSLKVHVVDAIVVYFGYDANVNSTTGFPVAASGGEHEFKAGCQVYARAASSSADVRYLDEFSK